MRFLDVKFVVFTMGFLSLSIMFQNCGGKVTFSQGAPTLTSDGGALSTATDQTPGTAGSNPQVSQTGTDSGSGGNSGGNSGSSSGSNSIPSCNSGGDKSDEVASANYECDFNGSNNKVILSQILQSGSNSSISRVCMSKEACLSVIGTYMAARDCKLSIGAPTIGSNNAPNPSNCVALFPGSRGVCKNAKILQDAEVASLLADMSRRK